MEKEREKAYLVLADGAVFEGQRIGYIKDSVGELVFTTGMVGYLETITDPSYCGQIIMQTFPLIGNYGVIPADFEGKPFLRGYVAREICSEPSNFRSEGALEAFLTENEIPGIVGVDTREITRKIREQGVMNAAIVSSVPESLDFIKGYAVTGAVCEVSTGERAVFEAEGSEKFRVALIDYGAKRNIVRCLTKRGCRVTVFPHNSAAEEILASAPDGIMLSNGPGDPAENTFEIGEIKKLLGARPMFGICLGHQLMALAMGGRTEKLKYGHRGANQPAKRLSDGRVFMTSQNHGYAVISESMAGRGQISYINANDQSCEGISYPEKRAFSVQFHPEASSGPHDTEFLFDDFLGLMGGD